MEAELAIRVHRIEPRILENITRRLGEGDIEKDDIRIS